MQVQVGYSPEGWDGVMGVDVLTRAAGGNPGADMVEIMQGHSVVA